MTNATAADIARLFFAHVVCVFGMPKRLFVTVTLSLCHVFGKVSWIFCNARLHQAPPITLKRMGKQSALIDHLSKWYDATVATVKGTGVTFSPARSLRSTAQCTPQRHCHRTTWYLVANLHCPLTLPCHLYMTVKLSQPLTSYASATIVFSLCNASFNVLLSIWLPTQTRNVLTRVMMWVLMFG